MANETRIVNIEGMTCQNCVKSIHDTAGKLEGVVTISVDLDDGQATVTYDPTKVTIEKVAETIDDAGFDATVANG